MPQGGRLRVTAENRLDEPTTVHWHGMRMPNAMDGVPHLTQEPIAPGESFVYEFDCPDAGTFWYHPHVRGFEQVGRGLYGPLIVEEPEGAAAPLAADRELTWVLDDWRLTEDGLDLRGFRQHARHGACRPPRQHGDAERRLAGRRFPSAPASASGCVSSTPPTPASSASTFEGHAPLDRRASTGSRSRRTRRPTAAWFWRRPCASTSSST